MKQQDNESYQHIIKQIKVIKMINTMINTNAIMIKVYHDQID